MSTLDNKSVQYILTFYQANHIQAAMADFDRLNSLFDPYNPELPDDATNENCLVAHVFGAQVIDNETKEIATLTFKEPVVLLQNWHDPMIYPTCVNYLANTCLEHYQALLKYITESQNEENTDETDHLLSGTDHQDSESLNQQEIPQTP